MERIKRLMRPVGIVMLVLGVIGLLGFVERTVDNALITALDVQVSGEEGMHFIDEQAIKREVLDQGVAEEGTPMRGVDVPAIEQRLRNIPSVANAEVYHTMDGVLHVKVRQRVPIVRVFNRDGSSFYIDEDGYTMPLSNGYTARVPVVGGDLHEPGVTHGVRSVLDNDSLMEHFHSDEIHRLAVFLRNDPFWNALIDQVYVNSAGEFELIPKIGAQRVLIGDGSELAERFAKLKVFYDKGIPQADWRRYARIDLRFADQIVCTNRPTP